MSRELILSSLQLPNVLSCLCCTESLQRQMVYRFFRSFVGLFCNNQVFLVGIAVSCHSLLP